MHSALAELAACYGIQTHYHRIDGSLCTAKPEVLLAILAAMGCHITQIEDAPAALQNFHEEKRKRVIEPVIVAWDGVLPPLNLPASAVVSPLPSPLPLGYHTLTVDCEGTLHQSLIIAAPRMAFTDSRKKWGTFLPLYAARSRRNWGAGDFSDLAQLAEWTAKCGGTVVGTLPLLPTKWEKDLVPSPYSPWSRLFWNPFYIDCELIPEMAHCPAAQKLIASTEFQNTIATCRVTPRVEYHAIMALKERVLHHLAQIFFNKAAPERRQQFDQYVQTHPDLIPYCDFLATTAPQSASWRNWIPRLLGQKMTQSQYHQYVQWIADQQIAHCADHARVQGVRLYLDFPIGANPDGYDAWRYKDLFIPNMRIGAPPDPFFDQGQDWGFQPMHPQRLRESGYRHFIDCIRHHLHYAGVLRLDHVMGFHRLFWIPGGFTAQDGVYVSYPAEEFYAILCLESSRRDTLIVGEDLGTVPTEVRTAMQTHGFLRMHILQFDPAFEYSTSIPSHCLAALNTHDMPPFAAFWGARPGAKEALHRYLECLAKSPAELCLINIEDLWLETEPQNRPGTVSPANWSHKAAHLIGDFDYNPDIVNLLQRFDQLRREVT